MKSIKALKNIKLLNNFNKQYICYFTTGNKNNNTTKNSNNNEEFSKSDLDLKMIKDDLNKEKINYFSKFTNIFTNTESSNSNVINHTSNKKLNNIKFLNKDDLLKQDKKYTKEFFELQNKYLKTKIDETKLDDLVEVFNNIHDKNVFYNDDR